jgi:hypothetical protein
MRARAVVGRFEGHLIHHHWITVMDIGAVSKGAAPCLWIVQACEASLFPIRQLGADRHHAPAGGMWRSAMRRAGMESKWFFGRYGFVFRNARLVPFRPCRGQLGFFAPDFTPPAPKPSKPSASPKAVKPSPQGAFFESTKRTRRHGRERRTRDSNRLEATPAGRYGLR